MLGPYISQYTTVNFEASALKGLFVLKDRLLESGSADPSEKAIDV